MKEGDLDSWFDGGFVDETETVILAPAKQVKSDEPDELPPAPSRPAIDPDPPALTKRLVSALGGETTDEALAPGEFRMFREEMRDAMGMLVGNVKTLTEQVLPLLTDHSRRIRDVEIGHELHDERIRDLRNRDQERADQVAEFRRRLDCETTARAEFELGVIASNARITELEGEVAMLRKRQHRADATKTRKSRVKRRK